MLVPRNKDVTCSGANAQLQTTGTVTQNGVANRTGDIFVTQVTFEADPANTSTVYIGCATGTGAAPSAPTTLTSANSLAGLDAGQSYTERAGEQEQRLGELIALSRFYTWGADSGQKILVSYTERVLNG